MGGIIKRLGVLFCFAAIIVFCLPVGTQAASVYGQEKDGISVELEESDRYLTREIAMDLTQKAVDKAKAENKGSTSLLVRDYNHLSLEALQGIAEIAGKMPLRLKADTITGGQLDVRITLEPALAVQDMCLLATMDSPRAVWIKELFEGGYDNQVMVISLAEPVGFGMSVEVIAKLEKGLDAETLFIYSYNRSSKETVLLEETGAWLDENGFLHFNTSVAGALVITDSPLHWKGIGENF
ncbi:hypothetical protein U6B65_03955 [Oscillospiraceae bacterium MB08-C2-2]|nr:hypothetical protein U6B65_03955 [Oscillospiraceae bacterium MB08-C2-2]